MSTRHDPNIILLALIFLFFSGLTLMIYLSLARRRERVENRLEDTPTTDAGGRESENLILGDMTEPLSLQIPISREDQEQLQKELRSAGLYQPTALMEYKALRAVLTIGPLIVGGVISLLWADTIADAVKVWIGALVVALLGFSLPRVYLILKVAARQRAIEEALPTAIDMLTLCLSAGLNVPASLERVANELYRAYPELAYEFQLIRRQAEMRSLEFALQQFAERTNLPQMRNVSVILSQSDRLGTDGITVLREYADSLRISLKQRAEAAANQAPLKFLIPGVMMFIGFLILLITPPAMEIRSFLKEDILGNMKQESQESLRESGLYNPFTSPNPPGKQ